MLKKDLKYQQAFNMYKVIDKNYKHCSSYEEYKRTNNVYEILKLFRVLLYML